MFERDAPAGGPEGGADLTVPEYLRVRDALVPSPDLAGVLAKAPLTELSEIDLVDTSVRWAELGSWVAAGEAAVLAELIRRSAAGGEPSEFLRDEVAAAHRTTGREAGALLDRASFLDVFPEIHDELAAGRLSARKADVLNAGTAHLAQPDAAAVIAEVLPRASDATAPALREAVRRCDLAQDPARAAARLERARRERCAWVEPAPDSMAFVKAYLPAADAMRVMTGLDAVAAAAAPEDERTLDQRRADALVDLVGDILDRGVGLDGAELPTRQGRRPHLLITATRESLLGLTETPAELAGYGPVPASVAREIAAVATWSPVVIDPRTGEVVHRSTRTYRPTDSLARAVIDRDVTCTFPGCRVSAGRCDLDHTDPFRDDGTDDPRADDQTRLGNLGALCRHHHRMKTHGGWAVSRDHLTGVTYWASPTGGTYTRDPHPAPFEPEPQQERRRLLDPERDMAPDESPGCERPVSDEPPEREEPPPF